MNTEGDDYVKRYVCVILILWMVVIIARSGTDRQNVAFDPEAEGILRVMTFSEWEGTEYYTLAAGKRAMKTLPFAPDSMKRYTVPEGCFESYIDSEANEVLNRLVGMKLEDEAGNSVDITEDFARIFECLAEFEHDMFNIEILDVSGRLFVFVMLNVNWRTPSTLYEFDAQACTLNELYTWNGKYVRGIGIPDAGV